MRIKTKLISSYLVIWLVAAIVGCIGYVAIQSMSDEYERLKSEEVPMIRALKDIKIGILRIVASTVEFVLTDDLDEQAVEINLIAGAKEEVTSNLQRVQDGASDDTGVDSPTEAEYAELQGGWDKFVALSDRVLDLKAAGASKEQIDDAKRTFEDSEEELLGTTDFLLSQQGDKMRQSGSDVRQTISMASTMSLSVIAAAGVASLIMAIRSSASIIRPLEKLDQAVANIAKGTLDTRVEVSGDNEIAGLSKSFNTMADELKKATDMQSTFYNIATHEMRTPIQPILGYIELAKKGLVTPKECIEVIEPNILKLNRLSKDLLDASRMEDHEVSYSMEDVKLEDILNEAVAEARQQVRSVKPGISIELDETQITAQVLIKADRMRLNQVLMNLINNAIKFMDNGVIRVSVYFPVNLDEVEIRVSDSGTGIPPEVLNSLFGKFVTKDVNGRNVHGTGLGLYICKKIIEAHSGRIWAANNRTRGATFTFALPIANMMPHVKSSSS